jgi:hypothetical protein
VSNLDLFLKPPQHSGHNRGTIYVHPEKGNICLCEACELGREVFGERRLLPDVLQDLAVWRR